MKVSVGILQFTNVFLQPVEISKFRGFIGSVFKPYNLIHNHDVDTGKLYYRYPLIQFKSIKETPIVLAITNEALNVFKEIFMTINEVIIDKRKIPVYEKDFTIKNVDIGFVEETYSYEFISPWLGLNQKNYDLYVRTGSITKKYDILKNILIGNILSMAKGLGIWLNIYERIIIESIKLKEKRVRLKGTGMYGFIGSFKTNFLIPDYLGIGKSVSRGFGAIRKIK
ncbi:MAG: hypothetical protein J7K04_12050 [Spirochaetales bacterium]|nr:hypothetical protein [Spirochaetales bacterium]